jgi:hypothetical protein
MDDFLVFLKTDNDTKDINENTIEISQAAIDKINNYLLDHTEVIDIIFIDRS